MAGALFDYILETVRQLDEEDSQDDKDYQEGMQAADRPAKYFLGKLHGFGDKKVEFDVWSGRLSPRLLDGMFEDIYLREMLERIPNIVARIRKLKIVTVQRPLKETEIYLREAART
ncbi:MAG TPA: hypothetical protein VFD30_11110 [Terriglobia bacterium]|nr:hypothetical protein [Terriglobia bacterium]